MTIPVLIIGAGLAGLYAGYLLHQRNIKFKILEADTRLGGRILSEPNSNWADDSLGHDMGPTWFWPHQLEMLALMRELNLDYFQQYVTGDALFEADSRAPIERFSPSYMESFRVTGGMHRIIDRLATLIPQDSIETGCAVKSMVSENGVWQVCSQKVHPHQSDPVYCASQLIIATPPRVIIDKIELADVGLNTLKKELLNLPTWMAAQAKFVATYDKAFWRDQGLSGQAFSRLGPMVEIHDSSSDLDASFALFGFIGVSAIQRQAMTVEALKQACLAQLVRIFGEQALHIEQCYLTDWAANPLIASPADLSEQPKHPQIDLTPYREMLIKAGIYFAGSEVAVRDAGYLQGALIAAADAVQALSREHSSVRQL
jgi:monoamine oxidase